MTDSSAKPTVLITGASSGIGAALALEFAERGYAIGLLARRRERIEKLAAEIVAKGGIAVPLEGDVTQLGSLKNAFQHFQSVVGNIEIVVANAGFAVSGTVSRLSNEDFQRQFETNIFGVLNTFRAGLAELEKSQGIFAIIGSIAGHVPLPFTAPYSMSKAAVRSLAYELRVEMQRKQVSVVHVSPGFIDTEIGQVDNKGVMHGKQVKKIPVPFIVPVAKAAKHIAKGILSRKREIIITQHGKWLVRLHHWFPELSEKLLFKLMTR